MDIEQLKIIIELLQGLGTEMKTVILLLIAIYPIKTILNFIGISIIISIIIKAILKIMNIFYENNWKSNAYISICSLLQMSSYSKHTDHVRGRIKELLKKE